MNTNVKRLAVSAMLIALSLALNELLKFDLTFVQGGSVTFFSMVPLCLIGWVWGVPWGLACGAIMGTLDMLLGGLGNFAWVSGAVAYLMLILFDYVIAYACIGTAGILRGRIKNDTLAFALGAGAACFLRFVCHFITGVTIWRDLTSDMLSSVIYSVTYNGAYMLPELIITAIGCAAVVNVRPLMRELDKKL